MIMISHKGRMRRSTALHDDTELVQKLRYQLENCEYRGLRSLHCEMQENGITLRGRVASFYLKQVVVRLITELKSSTPIHNEVCVIY
jgi:hypothetical protein